MRRLTCLVAALALLACGPTKSTTALIQARTAIKRAAYAEGQKKHPYELALAREYYVKAKEEAGYSQFEIAEKLAKLSISWAKLAAGEVPPPPPDKDEEPIEEAPAP